MAIIIQRRAACKCAACGREITDGNAYVLSVAGASLHPECAEMVSRRMLNDLAELAELEGNPSEEGR